MSISFKTTDLRQTEKTTKPPAFLQLPNDALKRIALEVSKISDSFNPADSEDEEDIDVGEYLVNLQRVCVLHIYCHKDPEIERIIASARKLRGMPGNYYHRFYL